MIEITTNNIPREVFHSPEDDSYYFTYKGEKYDLGEFTTTAGLDGPMDLWDGYLNWTYFSGVVVRYPRTENTIIVGRFYAA